MLYVLGELTSGGRKKIYFFLCCQLKENKKKVKDVKL